MLQTAIAIQLNGPEQIATIKDPLTGTPFEYRKLPDGFELKSKGSLRGKPISLIFAPAAKE